MRYVDIPRRVNVDIIRRWAAAAFVIANDDAIDSDFVRIENLDGPEAGALKGEAAAEMDVV